MKPMLSIALAATLLAGAAHAQVTVKDAWVRATVPQQKATGAFMHLHALSSSRLVAVSSPLTPHVEVHEMSMDGDIMRMRPVKVLDLPAGKAVELKPGGYHVMLLNLKEQVREGDTVPLTLVFESKDGKTESVKVMAPVRALAASTRPASGHGHP
ncbi:copper chaperone PCu(A)C [Massilia alkalitolerans]|uniref:copper chaperone PCu(A)C n=1 Tax=Massilia alkalitolerans TaxID=286638 RepID=UPI0028AE5A0F|nr:copper chaperone PCu(A)C [Massilia alkalitolerans]